MKIARFHNVLDRVPRSRETTWEQLAQALQKHSRREEKDGPLWSPTFYPNGATRGKAAVESICALVLDFDDGTPPDDLILAWESLEYVVHSTFSHSPESPKWRAVFPLAEPVPAGDWPQAYRRLAAALGQGHTDPACKDCSRIYYTPSAPPEGDVFSSHHAGEYVRWQDFPEVETPPAPTTTQGGGTPSGRYAAAALEKELAELRTTPEGQRNAQLNRAAFSLGQIVGAGSLERDTVEEALAGAAAGIGLDPTESEATIRSGLDAGELKPRTVPDPRPATRAEDPQHLTDLGNARRLVAAHGKDLRFCWDWNRWLVWDGRRWDDNSPERVFELAKDTVAGIYAEAAHAGEDRRKDLARHALKSESRDRLKAMIELAQSEPGIPVRPEELDRNQWLLNCPNGTVDLKTRELLPHRREDMLTKLIPTEYQPELTEAPVWEKFLATIFNGNREVIRFTQKAVGYSLTGDISEQCFFILHGQGQNGKSTMLSVIREILGEYGTRTPTETLLMKRYSGIPNDLAALRGTRFVMASETEDGRRLAESLIKDLTGGESISARFLHGEFFSFVPEFKIWLGTNHWPQIKGTDLAIWRRIRLIPFNQTIENPDRRFIEKLRPEYPAILAWAVRGVGCWQREGIEPPAEVKEATQAYREEQDILEEFLQEYCEFGPTCQAPAGELYDLFIDQHGSRAATKTAFGKALSEKGYERFQKKEQIEGAWKNVRYYLGIQLK